MSLGDYLKMALKKRISRFGGISEPFSLAQRAEDMLQQRRASRHSLISKRRNIAEMTLTPIYSPQPSIKAPVAKETKNDIRLQKLKQWKEDKQKRLKNDQAKQKPIFKVCHIEKTNRYDLSKVLKEIKGKPIGIQCKDSKKQLKIAPSSTHKFKPPDNIKPFYFNNITKSKDIATNNTNGPALTKGNANTKPHLNIRRTLKFEPESNKPTKGKNKNSGKNLKPTTTSKENVEPKEGIYHNTRGKQKLYPATKKVATLNPVKIVSSDQNNCISNNQPSTSTSHESTTPTNGSTPRTSVYISPYVTISRGKINARNEYKQKANGESCENGSSPNFSAKHFTEVVNKETERLQLLCEKWTQYKITENAADEVSDMINVAIGQTELLLSKKFKQFRSLIECCITGTSEKPVTSFDLHGFWDTVLLQINNLDKRFDNLESLKQNNWEEILPITRPTRKVKKVAVKNKTTASSGLMAAIKAARKKNRNSDTIIITEPSQSRRSSSRTSILISQSKPRISSPGFTIMKVTPFAKAIEKTPQSIPKSILKSGKKLHERENLKKSKVVLFEAGTLEDSLKENYSNNSNMTDTNVSNIYTPRRSARILSKINPRT